MSDIIRRQSAARRKHPKFEYLCVEVPAVASNNDIWNAISQPGGEWELISVVHVPADRESLPSVVRHYFKRPFELSTEQSKSIVQELEKPAVEYEVRHYEPGTKPSPRFKEDDPHLGDEY